MVLNQKPPLDGGMLISTAVARIKMLRCTWLNQRKVVTPDNEKQVLKIVLNDRKVKVSEIAEMVNISTGTAGTILHEKMGLVDPGTY